MSTEPEPTTEPEAKPITKTTINDRDFDELFIETVGDNIVLTVNHIDSVSAYLVFNPDQTPHTVAALKALMVAIEMDGGEVVR